MIKIAITNKINLEKPETIADLSPHDYVFKYKFHKYQKNPELKKITENMLLNIIENNPSLFFELKFQNVPEFIKFITPAAKSLILNEPLQYIFVYKLNENKEFINLLPLLFESLSEQENARTGKEYRKKEAILFEKVLKIVEDISKYNPQYYIESGLAEDEEFGKFFSNIGKKSFVLNYLFKISKDLKQKKQLDALNFVNDALDIIIKRI